MDELAALSLAIFILIATSCVTILIALTRKPKTIAPTLPPGPRKLPILGNLHNLIGPTLPHRRLMELAVEHGPLMQLQLGETSTVVVSSPEIAMEFLQTHDLNFATKPFLPSAATVLYNGRDIAFGPYGDYWRQMRKICVVELLSPKRVRSFGPIRAQEVNELVRSISMVAAGGGHEEAINLSKSLFSITYRITCRTAFGEKAQNQEEAFSPVLEQIMKALGGLNLWDLFPSSNLVRLVSGTERKLKKLHLEADVILEQVLRDHVARRRTERDHDKDLVDVLLNLSSKNHGLGFSITHLEIKAVILDMILGGSDTSAVTVEWTMSELIKHPRVMEKVQKEVKEMFDGKRTVDEADLDELHYLDMVIKESLRLHPPAPLIAPRECRETTVINGYHIPAKTRIIVNAWAMKRDPRHWNEPTEFYPERFFDTSIDYNGQNFKQNFKFIPFGAGRRVCPGIQSGMAMVKLLLAKLLYNFDWKLPNENNSLNIDMSEEFGLTVKRKNELFLIPVLRHPQPQ
ncbi:unnamed protein product [Linum tenue]|uniref:Cytochrome P450 n=1 Tax=Linum tenue TaxID=586396 RepID=A0AAV0NBX0_9ROSI|nr:unnamed protein product [Linum tenue]